MSFSLINFFLKMCNMRSKEFKNGILQNMYCLQITNHLLACQYVNGRKYRNLTYNDQLWNTYSLRIKEKRINGNVHTEKRHCVVIAVKTTTTHVIFVKIVEF